MMRKEKKEQKRDRVKEYLHESKKKGQITVVT